MISIRNLVKVYPGPVAALQGISLEIPSGMFGLLGPNGAGKTTLMRILSGVLEPTSGEVFVDGVNVLDDPQRLWQSLGYLPQDFGFFPHLTGQRMLEYLLELKGVEAKGGVSKLAGELLERVNLSYAAKRKVKEYSGGMRQRLGIAQAIAGDPRLIIVDEPTAGLDPEERLRFYRILAELAEKRTVLLSTHIVDDVAVLCPRFAIIRGGKVVALTSPREAKQGLEGRIFEGAVDEQALRDLPRTQRVLQSVLVEGENHVRIYSADMTAPSGFVSVVPTLEDAYLLVMRDEQVEQARGAA
ncbi:MAG: ATP-binding cassette domain-containing protein [Gemmatimonadaceae bacterium]